MRALLLSLAILVSSCKTTERTDQTQRSPTFTVSSTKSTFSPSKPLNAGDLLIFEIVALRHGETFIVQECGDPCNKAKPVAHRTGPVIDTQIKFVYEVMEDAKHYFWIRSVTPDGAVGPSFITDLREGNETCTVSFESGSKIKTTLVTNR